MIEPQTGCEEFEVAFVNCGHEVNRIFMASTVQNMR
jgi:hypothetical protein